MCTQVPMSEVAVVQKKCSSVSLTDQKHIERQLCEGKESSFISKELLSKILSETKTKDKPLAKFWLANHIFLGIS